jgi:molybdenum cofactor biosynthesis enzyme MoaA
LHVLPQGFFKVRYFGIFSSRYRKQNIELAREHLTQEQDDAKQEALEDGKQTWEKQHTVWNEILQIIMNYRKPNCPHCHKGRLHFAGLVPRNHGGPG